MVASKIDRVDLLDVSSGLDRIDAGGIQLHG